MHKLSSRLLQFSFTRFLLSGGFNTAVTYALYLALLEIFPYQISYSIAYASGIILAFILNRFFVFKSHRGIRSLLLFPFVYLIQYSISMATVWVWIEKLHQHEKLAPLIAIAITVPMTYLFSRFVFSNKHKSVTVITKDIEINSMKITNKNSLIKFPDIPRPAIMLGIGTLFILGLIFLIEQHNKVSFDAYAYIGLARRFDINGMMETPESLRTFAYPLILSLLIKFSQIVNLPESVLFFLVQISVYYFVLVVASNVANEYSQKLSTAIYLALCANIFVIPYTSVTLTDSLYISIAILLFVGMMKIESQQKSGKSLSVKWVFFGVLLLSLAITIRPAAIWITIPVFYCLIRLLWNRSINIFYVLLVIIFGATPLYVQIILNVTNYGVFSFLPIRNLGADQIKWGIENIKYAAWMGGGNEKNFYPSILLIKELTGDLNLSWYFNNPIDAIKLLTFKLIGAFDFDYLIPYPYHQPTNKWLLSFFSFTILWLGVFGVLVHLYTNKLILLGSRFMPIIIFISWGSVSLVSAIELRFTLPLISYFIIVGCTVIHFVITNKNRNLLLSMVIGWIFFMPLLYHAAKFIRSQSTVNQWLMTL